MVTVTQYSPLSGFYGGPEYMPICIGNAGEPFNNSGAEINVALASLLLPDNSAASVKVHILPLQV
jgi:hypothetical protein